jgi:SAM-dependent methyltransferase
MRVSYSGNSSEMTVSFGSWEAAVQWLRSQPDKQDLVRECYYDQPLLGAARRYSQSAEWRAIQELIGKGGGNALDVGAGQGIASYALSESGWSVTSVEPDSSAMVGASAIRQLSLETGLDIHPVRSVGERLPFVEDSFDLVFARQVLHHAEDLNLLCRELARVLRSGGLLVAVRDHVLSRAEDLDEFLAVHPLHRLYGGENAYLLNEYTSALRGAGLDIVKTLSPFGSQINFAPLSAEALVEELTSRLQEKTSISLPLRWIGKSRSAFWMLCRILDLIDSRPGRLYSFVCRKP